jgi:hypothetical protein
MRFSQPRLFATDFTFYLVIAQAWEPGRMRNSMERAGTPQGRTAEPKNIHKTKRTSMSIISRRIFTIGLALVAALAIPTAASAAQDRKAPTTPKNLHVQNVALTWFTLAWDASTDNSGTVMYDVTLTTPTGPRTERAFSPTQSFGGLEPGTTFTASVRATDLAGNTSAAVSIQVTTPPRTLPSPITPANLRAVFVGGVLDRIAWDASSHPTGVSYWLRNGESVIHIGSTTDATVFDLLFIDCAVERGGTYTITVQALSHDLDFSGRSAPLTVTIP